MSYTPPGFGSFIALDGPYAQPLLSNPVVLTAGGRQITEGALQAALPPPPVPALSFSARAAQDNSYRPPLVGSNVRLATPYNKPALPAPLVLCQSVEPSGTVQAELRADLPAPRLATLTMIAESNQLLELPDNDGTRTIAKHKLSYPKTATLLKLWAQDADQIHIPMATQQQHGNALNKTLAMPSAETLRIQSHLALKHQHGIPRHAGAAARHTDSLRTRVSQRTRHAHGLKLNTQSGIPHAEKIRRRNSVRMKEQQALPVTKRLGIGQRNGWPSGTRLEVRWQHGIKPAPGYWWPTYKPPGLTTVIDCRGDYIPRPLHCDIILGAAYPVQPPCAIDPDTNTIIIPVREEYYVINDFTLTLPDGTEVFSQDFSASIDADSWTWSWSARIHGDDLLLMRPDNTTRVELIATINGEPIRVLVENIGRERKFGESWLRISGRGHAALLAGPLAPVLQHSNSSSLTALQCLEDTLKDNGVPIGWLVNWQIADWQVPAGLWSHTGTWMDAAKRIAEAGGGYVQADDSTQTLHILPKYPTAPWNWSATTPDIQMPEDVVEVEGIDWEEKPDYNAVWVHGGDQGRADQIVITGTDGGKSAPTVVDTLATDTEMTRQRGLAVLGDTGKQATISLRLPVLPETGMIKPGKFVEYVENGAPRRGLVRSLSIAHNWPELWQTIGVETHE